MLYEQQQLAAELLRHGVPIHRWGTGVAKTIDHLAQELNDGECTLIVKDERCVRLVIVVAIDVFAEYEGKKYILVEDRQVFNDGRKRTRTLTKSLGDKLRPNEHPSTGAMRAIHEELGILTEKLVIVPKGMQENPLMQSMSYPGLPTKYILHDFEIVIPPEHFRSEGYVEVQADKTTYFVWKEIGGGS